MDAILALRELAPNFSSELRRLHEYLETCGKDHLTGHDSRRIQAALEFVQRGEKIQQSIAGLTAAIDGLNNFFQDSFGADMRESVPIFDSAVEITAQSAIIAMKLFLRDAARFK